MTQGVNDVDIEDDEEDVGYIQVSSTEDDWPEGKKKARPHAAGFFSVLITSACTRFLPLPLAHIFQIEGLEIEDEEDIVRSADEYFSKLSAGMCTGGHAGGQANAVVMWLDQVQNLPKCVFSAFSFSLYRPL